MRPLWSGKTCSSACAADVGIVRPRSCGIHRDKGRQMHVDIRQQDAVSRSGIAGSRVWVARTADSRYSTRAALEAVVSTRAWTCASSTRLAWRVSEASRITRFRRGSASAACVAQRTDFATSLGREVGCARIRSRRTRDCDRRPFRALRTRKAKRFGPSTAFVQICAEARECNGRFESVPRT
jgi:hypothetical protein